MWNARFKSIIFNVKIRSRNHKNHRTIRYEFINATYKDAVERLMRELNGNGEWKVTSCYVDGMRIYVYLRG
jgi:hypothetical protein